MTPYTILPPEITVLIADYLPTKSLFQYILLNRNSKLTHIHVLHTAYRILPHLWYRPWGEIFRLLQPLPDAVAHAVVRDIDDLYWDGEVGVDEDLEFIDREGYPLMNDFIEEMVTRNVVRARMEMMYYTSSSPIPVLHQEGVGELLIDCLLTLPDDVAVRIMKRAVVVFVDYYDSDESSEGDHCVTLLSTFEPQDVELIDSTTHPLLHAFLSGPGIHQHQQSLQQARKLNPDPNTALLKQSMNLVRGRYYHNIGWGSVITIASRLPDSEAYSLLTTVYNRQRTVGEVKDHCRHSELPAPVIGFCSHLTSRNGYPLTNAFFHKRALSSTLLPGLRENLDLADWDSMLWTVRCGDTADDASAAALGRECARFLDAMEGTRMSEGKFSALIRHFYALDPERFPKLRGFLMEQVDWRDGDTVRMVGRLVLEWWSVQEALTSRSWVSLPPGVIEVWQKMHDFVPAFFKLAPFLEVTTQDCMLGICGLGPTDAMFGWLEERQEFRFWKEFLEKATEWKRKGNDRRLDR
ncbi:hypothetical protein HDV00_002438 [Rhizophlyctis rosea]|nr:hypothetical protein HDV00_002438 [Rhizophlyctis rosea]